MSSAFRMPTEAFYRVPYRMAGPYAARKVYACLQAFLYAQGGGDRLVIGNKRGAEWCTEMFGDDPFGDGRYGNTGRRCFQKGLGQLEARGIIRREFHKGVRTIVILVRLHEAKPKASRPARTPKGAPRTIPMAAAIPAPPPADEPEPDDSPVDVAATWAALKAKQKELDRAAKGAVPASPPAPSPKASRDRIRKALGFDPADPEYLRIKAEMERKQAERDARRPDAPRDQDE